MGWFAKKSAAAPLRPGLPLWAASSGEAFPRSYQAQVGEVYVSNPVGQRAVRLVAGAVGALTVYSLSGKAKAAELVNRPGLLETAEISLLQHEIRLRRRGPVPRRPVPVACAVGKRDIQLRGCRSAVPACATTTSSSAPAASSAGDANVSGRFGDLGDAKLPAAACPPSTASAGARPGLEQFQCQRTGSEFWAGSFVVSVAKRRVLRYATRIA